MSLDLSQQVKTKLSLSAVVRNAVELKGNGARYLGLCPFHQEKTPSFQVRDDLGRYKCFGCGASGDIFEFVMRLRGLSFKEAVAELAIKAGISSRPILKKSSAHPVNNQAQSWLLAHKVAHAYFIEQLRKKDAGMAARRYLIKERKLTVPMLEQAGIGFGGAFKEDFVSYLKAHNISSNLAISAGLLKEGPFSTTAPFLNRIIFPIRRMDGRVIAFGGRSFLTSDVEVPKYVNTHGGGLYEKRKTFYGLFESRAAIEKGQTPFLVEGYFDAMAMWAAGFPALALCGTALSLEHATILRRLSSRLNIAFDNDAAGLKALRSALFFLFGHSIQARVVVLDKKDPGEYLASDDLGALGSKVAEPIDALCYIIDNLALSKSSDIANRVAQIDELLPIFSKISRPLIRRQYVVYLAEKLHEDPSLLWMEITKRNKVSSAKSAQKTENLPKLNSEERLLAPLFLAHPDLIKKTIGLEEMLSPDYLAYFLNGQQEPLGSLIRKFGEEGLSLSLSEAEAVLLALHQRVEKKKLKEARISQRQKLYQAQKDKDFSSVLATLKEQSQALKKGKEDLPKNKPVPTPPSRIKPLRESPQVLENEEEGWL